MRVFGFSKKWEKLHLELPMRERLDFTTFRLPRKDADRSRDWRVGETVQVWYKPRSKKHREFLGVATFIAREPSRNLYFVTDAEAVADGFESRIEMWNWFVKTHGLMSGKTLNKLTLRWGP